MKKQETARPSDDGNIKKGEHISENARAFHDLIMQYYDAELEHVDDFYVATNQLDNKTAHLLAKRLEKRYPPGTKITVSKSEDKKDCFRVRIANPQHVYLAATLAHVATTVANICKEGIGVSYHKKKTRIVTKKMNDIRTAEALDEGLIEKGMTIKWWSTRTEPVSYRIEIGNYENVFLQALKKFVNNKLLPLTANAVGYHALIVQSIINRSGEPIDELIQVPEDFQLNKYHHKTQLRTSVIAKEIAKRLETTLKKIYPETVNIKIIPATQRVEKSYRLVIENPQAVFHTAFTEHFNASRPPVLRSENITFSIQQGNSLISNPVDNKEDAEYFIRSLNKQFPNLEIELNIQESESHDGKIYYLELANAESQFLDTLGLNVKPERKKVDIASIDVKIPEADKNARKKDRKKRKPKDRHASEKSMFSRSTKSTNEANEPTKDSTSKHKI